MFVLENDQGVAKKQTYISLSFSKSIVLVEDQDQEDTCFRPLSFNRGIVRG